MRRLLFALSLLAFLAPSASAQVKTQFEVAGVLCPAEWVNVTSGGACAGTTMTVAGGLMAVSTNPRITGDGTPANPLDLQSIGAIASCGDGTHVGVITVDAYGRTTACVATAITFPPATHTLQQSYNDGAAATGGNITLGVPGPFSITTGVGNVFQVDGTYSALNHGLGTTTTANYCEAGGIESSATRVSQSSYASGGFGSVAGTAQTAMLVMRGSTAGLAPGETVELMYGDPLAQYLTGVGGMAYTTQFECVAQSAGNQSSYKQMILWEQAGGIPAIIVSGASENLDSGGGWTWTFGIAGGPARLAVTFSTHTDTAAVDAVCTVRFTETIHP